MAVTLYNGTQIKRSVMWVLCVFCISIMCLVQNLATGWLPLDFSLHQRVLTGSGTHWISYWLCNGQTKQCLKLTIISMQSRAKYFLQLHFHSLLHLHGFVSKVEEFQLSKSLLRQWCRKRGLPLWGLLLDKDMGVTWTIVNSALGTTSG
jgi:hypothetical protein